MRNQSIIFIANSKQSIFNCFTQAQIGENKVITTNELRANPQEYANVKIMFSTWGVPLLSKAEVAQMLPNLKSVFYAAGSINHFAQAYFENGVRIFSAYKANAVAVAEYTVAQIILSNKGYFTRVRKYKEQRDNKSKLKYAYLGNYHTKIGIIGAGEIGKKVLEFLKPYDLDIYVYDKFLSKKQITSLGGKKEDLDYIFKNCLTISNHLANKTELNGFLNKNYFNQMLPNATFINTGRGAQVNLDDLVCAMKKQPFRCALLDVTDPLEPLPHDHMAWECENIIITPHIAGSQAQEIYRMGEMMIKEFENYQNEIECKNEITPQMLKTMA